MVTDVQAPRDPAGLFEALGGIRRDLKSALWEAKLTLCHALVREDEYGADSPYTETIRLTERLNAVNDALRDIDRWEQEGTP